MTGREHYREAERLLTVAQEELRDSTKADFAAYQQHVRQAGMAQQRAQVHATLALASATLGETS